MRENGVIEGLAQIALFLAAVCSYAYLVWARKLLILAMTGRRYAPGINAIQRSTLFLSTQKSGSPAQRVGIAGSASAKSKFSAAGDWLVPVIVWVLVILMTLAIVGFLLGDR